MNELYNEKGIRDAICHLEAAKLLLLKHFLGGSPGVVDERMAKRIGETHVDIWQARTHMEAALAEVKKTETNMYDWLGEYSRSRR